MAAKKVGTPEVVQVLWPKTGEYVVFSVGFMSINGDHWQASQRALSCGPPGVRSPYPMLHFTHYSQPLRLSLSSPSLSHAHHHHRWFAAEVNQSRPDGSYDVNYCESNEYEAKVDSSRVRQHTPTGRTATLGIGSDKGASFVNGASSMKTPSADTTPMVTMVDAAEQRSPSPNDGTAGLSSKSDSADSGKSRDGSVAGGVLSSARGSSQSSSASSQQTTQDSRGGLLSGGSSDPAGGVGGAGRRLDPRPSKKGRKKSKLSLKSRR